MHNTQPNEGDELIEPVGLSLIKELLTDSKEFQAMEIVLHHIKGSISGTATPFSKSSTIIHNRLTVHLIMYPG